CRGRSGRRRRERRSCCCSTRSQLAVTTTSTPTLRQASWATGASSKARTSDPLTAPPGGTSTSAGAEFDATRNEGEGHESSSVFTAVVVPCRRSTAPVAFFTEYNIVASVPG